MHEVQLFNNIIPHIFMGAKIKLLDILGFFLDNKRKETWIYMLVFLNLNHLILKGYHVERVLNYGKACGLITDFISFR